jgi:tetratricopeptide (TPR) repeat protein
MNIKKPITTTQPVNQSKPTDKKQETPLLIWYNKNNEEKNREDIFTYYNNPEQCIETIKQSTKPIFLILNSSSATDLLSRIHSLNQIDTIFISCKSSREQQRCQYLLEHYSKIFDLFLDRKQLLDTIHENINLYQNQSGNDYLRLAERYKPEQQELNRAFKYTHKALEIYQKTFSNPNHPLIARCFNNLGGICDAQGDVNRSFEYYEQAIKIYAHLTPSLSNQPVSNILKK